MGIEVGTMVSTAIVLLFGVALGILFAEGIRSILVKIADTFKQLKKNEEIKVDIKPVEEK